MIMTNFDVILLTEDRYEQPKTLNPYIENLLWEDRLVQEALEKKGLRVGRFSWSNPNVDWSRCAIALFRTTWDYFHRFQEFSRWLDQVKDQTRLFNPTELLMWNLDKHYLQDLERKGVHTVPTHFIETGSQQSLTAIHAELGWTHTVVKPAVSGAARHTYRLAPENLGQHEPIFRELIAKEALLLQPFQNYIVEQGELSLMIFGGQYTHAVRKVAKPGDFRVQDDFGGTVHLYHPTAEERAFAEAAVAACDPSPIYARVDIIRDNEGHLAIVELELIEPELWFRLHPPAADLLAEKVQAELLNPSI
jgi:glutathione synthase/RimK-type ligase-like ATP-grasp enzyme